MNEMIEKYLGIEQLNKYHFWKKIVKTKKNGF